MRLLDIFSKKSQTTYYEPFDVDVESKAKHRARSGFTLFLIAIASASILMFYGLYRFMLSLDKTTAVTGTPVTTSTSMNMSHATSESSLRTYPCGTSLAEAHAAGCIFDPLTVYWLPPRCSTLYANEFLQAADATVGQAVAPSTAYSRSVRSLPQTGIKWSYYSQPPASALKSDASAASYFSSHSPTWHDLSTVEIDTPYLTTHGEHLTHCAYMLIRLAHLVSSGETHLMDRMTSHFEHSRHCTLMLLDAARESSTWNRVDSTGEVRSGDC